MSEIVDYVNHGAAQITPRIIEGLLRKIPLLKAEFAQINEPRFPHLVDQLEFLADAVEDFAEGAYKDLPLSAAAAAAFALIYAHKTIDLIPDSIPHMGRADDSSVVRAVLIQHEKAFSVYASTHGLRWDRITSKP
jgi:uncharacterized membrane protein YkvA (DUF1232 family)